MSGNPTIKITGAGSRHAAAELGDGIARGVSAALAGSTEPMHVDTLRIRLPANAGKAALEQAVRAALAGKGRRG